MYFLLKNRPGFFNFRRLQNKEANMLKAFNKPIFTQLTLCFSALFLSESLLHAATPSSVKTETLLKSESSWEKTPYIAYPSGTPELSVVKITIPPHTELPWHTHPFPIAGYILSGEITLEKKETGERQLVTAGQAVPETVNIAHRGVTGDSPGCSDCILSRNKRFTFITIKYFPVI